MQIALNILMYGRLATTNLGTNAGGFSRSYGFRSTSVNYNPEGNESRDWFPESMYWRFRFDGDSRDTPLLPQTPGPHITEVRLVFEPEAVRGSPAEFRVKYRLESEYYMHPFGPKVMGGDFPTRVDYLKFEFLGESGGEPRVVEFGPNSPLDCSSHDREHDIPHVTTFKFCPAGRFELEVVNPYWSGLGVGDEGVALASRNKIGSIRVSQRELRPFQGRDGSPATR
jgi:hypothetical protein